MTVAELIKELSHFDPKREIRIITSTQRGDQQRYTDTINGVIGHTTKDDKKLVLIEVLL